MNPYHVIGKSRHCPKCRVGIASLNCPRCGRLTELGPYVRAARRVPHDRDVFVLPDYVVSQEVYGREDRKKTPVPRADS